MTVLPANILAALPLPPQPIPIGPITPGTGPTNLGKAEAADFTTGDVGVMGLGVVDDGTVEFPAAGKYTPARLDPVTRGVIVGPAVGDPANYIERGVIPMFARQGLFGDSWQPVTIDPTTGALPIYTPGTTVLSVAFLGGITINNDPLVVAQQFQQSQFGPYVNPGDTFSTPTPSPVTPFGPQRSLSVALSADGTVLVLDFDIEVLDVFGNKVTVATLHAGAVGIGTGVLTAVVVGFPFSIVRGTATAITLGTATGVTWSLTTSVH